MADGIYGDNIIHHLEKFIGETVTIFTTSGGESGRGFTGVLMSVNCDFVRLVTRIGEAPSCTLGNACDEDFEWGRNGRMYGNGYRRGCGNRYEGFRGTGSVVDIPVDRIASFVHNAIH